MVLSSHLRRRLAYLETQNNNNSWSANSVTDYSTIVMSYTAKVAALLILLCVDLGFNSSLDHNTPAPAGQEGDAAVTLTFGMIYFGSQVSALLRALTRNAGLYTTDLR